MDPDLKVTDPELFSDTEDYADVRTYVTTSKGDWRFMVSLDKSHNTIYDGEVCFSPGPEAPFDCLNADDVDPDARAAFAAVRDRAVNILHALQP